MSTSAKHSERGSRKIERQKCNRLGGSPRSNTNGKAMEERSILDEYISSLNYINACHQAINKIIRHNNSATDIAMPDIPNYLSILHYMGLPENSNRDPQKVHNIHILMDTLRKNNASTTANPILDSPARSPSRPKAMTPENGSRRKCTGEDCRSCIPRRIKHCCEHAMGRSASCRGPHGSKEPNTCIPAPRSPSAAADIAPRDSNVSVCKLRDTMDKEASRQSDAISPYISLTFDEMDECASLLFSPRDELKVSRELSDWNIDISEIVARQDEIIDKNYFVQNQNLFATQPISNSMHTLRGKRVHVDSITNSSEIPPLILNEETLRTKPHRDSRPWKDRLAKLRTTPLPGNTRKDRSHVAQTNLVRSRSTTIVEVDASDSDEVSISSKANLRPTVLSRSYLPLPASQPRPATQPCSTRHYRSSSQPCPSLQHRPSSQPCPSVQPRRSLLLPPSTSPLPISIASRKRRLSCSTVVHTVVEPVPPPRPISSRRRLGFSTVVSNSLMPCTISASRIDEEPECDPIPIRLVRQTSNTASDIEQIRLHDQEIQRQMKSEFEKNYHSLAGSKQHQTTKDTTAGREIMRHLLLAAAGLEEITASSSSDSERNNVTSTREQQTTMHPNDKMQNREYNRQQLSSPNERQYNNTNVVREPIHEVYNNVTPPKQRQDAIGRNDLPAKDDTVHNLLLAVVKKLEGVKTNDIADVEGDACNNLTYSREHQQASWPQRTPSQDQDFIRKHMLAAHEQQCSNSNGVPKPEHKISNNGPQTQPDPQSLGHYSDPPPKDDTVRDLLRAVVRKLEEGNTEQISNQDHENHNSLSPSDENSSPADEYKHQPMTAACDMPSNNLNDVPEPAYDMYDKKTPSMEKPDALHPPKDNDMVRELLRAAVKKMEESKITNKEQESASHPIDQGVDQDLIRKQLAMACEIQFSNKHIVPTSQPEPSVNLMIPKPSEAPLAQPDPPPDRNTSKDQVATSQSNEQERIHLNSVPEMPQTVERNNATSPQQKPPMGVQLPMDPTDPTATWEFMRQLVATVTNELSRNNGNEAPKQEPKETVRNKNKLPSRRVAQVSDKESNSRLNQHLMCELLLIPNGDREYFSELSDDDCDTSARQRRLAGQVNANRVRDCLEEHDHVNGNSEREREQFNHRTVAQEQHYALRPDPQPEVQHNMRQVPTGAYDTQYTNKNVRKPQSQAANNRTPPDWSPPDPNIINQLILTPVDEINYHNRKNGLSPPYDKLSNNAGSSPPRQAPTEQRNRKSPPKNLRREVHLEPCTDDECNTSDLDEDESYITLAKQRQAAMRQSARSPNRNNRGMQEEHAYEMTNRNGRSPPSNQPYSRQSLCRSPNKEFEQEHDDNFSPPEDADLGYDVPPQHDYMRNILLATVDARESQEGGLGFQQYRPLIDPRFIPELALDPDLEYQREILNSMSSNECASRNADCSPCKNMSPREAMFQNQVGSPHQDYPRHNRSPPYQDRLPFSPKSRSPPQGRSQFQNQRQLSPQNRPPFSMPNATPFVPSNQQQFSPSHQVPLSSPNRPTLSPPNRHPFLPQNLPPLSPPKQASLSPPNRHGFQPQNPSPFPPLNLSSVSAQNQSLIPSQNRPTISPKSVSPPPNLPVFPPFPPLNRPSIPPQSVSPPPNLPAFPPFPPLNRPSIPPQNVSPPQKRSPLPPNELSIPPQSGSPPQNLSQEPDRSADKTPMSEADALNLKRAADRERNERILRSIGLLNDTEQMDRISKEQSSIRTRMQSAIFRRPRSDHPQRKEIDRIDLSAVIEAAEVAKEMN